MLEEPIAVTLRLVETLDALGIQYLVGGSVASSVHGLPRATNDVDLVAIIPGAKVSALASALEADFYVDADMIRDAIKRRASFNLIHLATMMKVDIFVHDGSDLAIEEMARRTPIVLADGKPPTWLASPEDIVLQKLDWYRKGGGTSDRQWSDVVGVLRVQGAGIDKGYLERWGDALQLRDLLRRALDDAAIG